MFVKPHNLNICLAQCCNAFVMLLHCGSESAGDAVEGERPRGLEGRLCCLCVCGKYTINPEDCFTYLTSYSTY